MKKFFALMLVFLSFQILAASSPLDPSVEDALNARTGIKKQLVVHVGIDSTKASGTTLSSGFFLPPASLVIRNYSVVKTTVVSASDNTLSWGCASSTDLDAAADYTDTAVGATNEGAASGASTASVYSAAGCEIKAYVGSGTTGILSGAVVHVIDYLDLN